MVTIEYIWLIIVSGIYTPNIQEMADTVDPT
jgi:hypothetical protein